MNETITINIERLERLLKDREYAKEWKAIKYNELLEENIKLKEENKVLIEQKEYWEREYLKQDEKAERYRNKYIKWKRKAKGFKGQRRIKEQRVKRKTKCNKCNKYGHYVRDCKETKRECYTCGKKGHKQKDCYKNQICKKCNMKGHTEKVCRSKKLERKEE